MTEKKRFRMEIIEGASLPFIVDNDSAKKQSDKITSYHTYKTDKKNKCLELVELLNTLHEENEQLRKDREDLFYRERDTKNDWRELKQENEKLKQENQELHQLNQEYINNLSDEKKETLSKILNAILGDDGE